jgi:alcohol dehydrogenase (cytochrome c)
VQEAEMPTTVGGEGNGEFPMTDAVNLTGTVLAVDGTLYIRVGTTPGRWVRAPDVLWHYFWKARGTTHRQSGDGDVEQLPVLRTPDDILISLDAGRARSDGTSRSRISDSSTSRPWHRS